MELFATVGDKYVDLGLDAWLDLPGPKVAEMRRNVYSPFQRREPYLDLYVNGHPCPSWRQVAEVLRLVELPHQADTVERTYVQGTRIIPIHPLSVTVVRFVIAYHDTGTFPVTWCALLIIIVRANLKAGAGMVFHLMQVL